MASGRRYVRERRRILRDDRAEQCRHAASYFASPALP
jgi:hypothetical protein